MLGGLCETINSVGGACSRRSASSLDEWVAQTIGIGWKWKEMAQQMSAQLRN